MILRGHLLCPHSGHSMLAYINILGALSLNLSKSRTEKILIASQLTQHNKRHYNAPPCPASSVKANLGSSRMFSQSSFWWTVTFGSSAVVACSWNNFLTVFFLHNLEWRKFSYVPEALSQKGEKKKNTKSVLKQRHRGIDKKKKDWSRPAQPKSSNT